MAEIVALVTGSTVRTWWNFSDLPVWSPQTGRGVENRGFLSGGAGGDAIRAYGVWPVGTYFISDISVDTTHGYDVTLTLQKILDT